jgi:hypothetical protein
MAMTDTDEPTGQQRDAASADRAGATSSARDKRRSVAIFGAGITGLTAAHELIERGYQVEVFEIEPPGPSDDVCSIGGMAKTQWSRTEVVDRGDLVDRMRPTQDIDYALERGVRERIYFKPQLSGEHDVEAGSGDEPTCKGKKTLKRIVELMTGGKWRRSYASTRVEVRGFDSDTHWRRDLGGQPTIVTEGSRIDFERAEHVRKELLKAGVKNDLTAYGFGLGEAEDWRRSDAERCYVELHLVQDYLPGEHGFRFFPTLYRNLRDTMRRTPVAQDLEPFVETPRTVFDNIVSARIQGINVDPDPNEPKGELRNYSFERKPIASVQKLFDLLVASLKASRFEFDDINAWSLKLFKYVTSCPERRLKYEDISWWDFVDGDSFSEAFGRYLDNTPQALVAMTAKEADARTYGNVTLQLMQDQITEGAVVDGILNGPTSLAWFAHWRRYLESQGVIFRRGKLVRFEKVGDTVFPCVKIPDKDPAGAPDPHRGASNRVIVRDYYVLALSIEAARELVDRDPDLCAPDFVAIRKMVLGDPEEAKPRGALQHLSGIQYFLPAEMKFYPGHTIFADAEWGLSAVFQPQFWYRKRGWWDGYRGILSVGIGNWYTESAGDGGKTAWSSTAEEIANEVWRQIVRTTDRPENRPTPTLFHLDRGIEFENDRPKRNKSRILINTPGLFRQRPGGREANDRIRYHLQYDSVVLAGTYMQTYMRLTTMEAANESARHAVNAILRHDREYCGDLCEIIDPERVELDDLKYFVDLDRALVNAGLPHFVDILEPESLTEDLLKGVLDPRLLHKLGAS